MREFPFVLTSLLRFCSTSRQYVVCGRRSTFVQGLFIPFMNIHWLCNACVLVTVINQLFLIQFLGDILVCFIVFSICILIFLPCVDVPLNTKQTNKRRGKFFEVVKLDCCIETVRQLASCHVTRFQLIVSSN